MSTSYGTAGTTAIITSGIVKARHPRIAHKKKVRVRKPLVSDTGVALQLGVAFFAHHVSTYSKHPDGGRCRHFPRRGEPPRSCVGNVRGGTRKY